MKTYPIKSDTTGIIASTLCMIHCVSTPFIFIAQTCTATCCSSAPVWWKWIDIVFLIVSLFAIVHASKHTNKTWVKNALYFCWTLLLLVILNEQFHLFALFENAIHIPALTLVILHFYNIKYCKCLENSCTTGEKEASYKL